MNKARVGLGCAISSVYGSQHVIVAGERYEYYKRLDSFETLNKRGNKRILQSSKLPRAISGLQFMHVDFTKYLGYAIGGSNQGI